MGSRASKIAKSAATPARRYPTRTPPTSQTTNTTDHSLHPGEPTVSLGPNANPDAKASWQKTEAIKNDASDPDFQGMLRTIGHVQQAQTLPDAAKTVPTSELRNPQLRTVLQRIALEQQREEELEDPKKRKQRSWVDVFTIREILMYRDEKGWADEKIESELGLNRGLVRRLGKVVSNPEKGVN